jgi:gas vesicle protein GvpG
MGLIKEIVLLPVAPFRGTLWVAERIADQVEQERYGDGAVVEQLDRLEEAKQSGELDEREAAEREEEILEEQLVRAAPAGREEG